MIGRLEFEGTAVQVSGFFPLAVVLLGGSQLNEGIRVSRKQRHHLLQGLNRLAILPFNPESRSSCKILVGIVCGTGRNPGCQYQNN
jgi:hypothetical protein